LEIIILGGSPDKLETELPAELLLEGFTLELAEVIVEFAVRGATSSIA